MENSIAGNIDEESKFALEIHLFPLTPAAHAELLCYVDIQTYYLISLL